MVRNSGIRNKVTGKKDYNGVQLQHPSYQNPLGGGSEGWASRVANKITVQGVGFRASSYRCVELQFTAPTANPTSPMNLSFAPPPQP